MKLLFSLILFAIVLVVVIMSLNRQMLLQNLAAEHEENRRIIETSILTDMQLVDKAHLYFDTEITALMEKELRGLRAYYEQNAAIDSWDIEAIKARTQMEFYIIDEQNTVVRTTYKASENLNFNECCENFAKLLEERRQSDAFFSDGLDNSAATYDLWKYSYLATPDAKYILELGIPITKTEIYQAFNFFDVAERLVTVHQDLMQLRIIKKDGFFLPSKEGVGERVENLSRQFNEAYEKAILTKQPVEYQLHLAGDVVETHRFLPYEAEVQRGNSTERVIYMVFSNEGELALLEKSNKQFAFILIIAIATALLLLIVIMKILTKTINLATYDPLTGAYNRASYLQYMNELAVKQNRTRIGLLLIDIDYFKMVNDQFGHLVGDRILQEMAQLLMQATPDDYVVRFGGDEFAIVVEQATKEYLESLAEKILTDVRTPNNVECAEAWSIISASIGGAIQLDLSEEEQSLFSRADEALYKSKHLGKNCYTFTV